MVWGERKARCVIEMGTFGAALAALSRQQFRVVTVGLWAVLLDVLTAHFPKYLPSAALLLRETKHESTSPNLA